MGGGPHAPLGAVADDGAADLSGGGESHTDQRGVVLPIPGLDHHGAPGARKRPRSSQKVWSLTQALDLDRGVGHADTSILPLS